MLSPGFLLFMFFSVGLSDGIASRRPHILMLLADDYGWANLGVHRTDDGTTAAKQAMAEVHTPTLDGLIAEGVLLERHYAFPICAPSRSSFQSGRSHIPFC